MLEGPLIGTDLFCGRP